jgi:pimeloyl-ACP methyl ester carboxylesterase
LAARANEAPLPPAAELAWWYQFYFATERGRAGYDRNRNAFAKLIWKLATGPMITVPTITLEGDANGAPHPEPAAYAARFTGKYVHRTLAGGIGHNLPQEAPLDFAHAIEEVDGFA